MSTSQQPSKEGRKGVRTNLATVHMARKITPPPLGRIFQNRVSPKLDGNVRATKMVVSGISRRGISASLGASSSPRCRRKTSLIVQGSVLSYLTCDAVKQPIVWAAPLQSAHDGSRLCQSTNFRIPYDHTLLIDHKFSDVARLVQKQYVGGITQNRQIILGGSATDEPMKPMMICEYQGNLREYVLGVYLVVAFLRESDLQIKYQQISS